MNWWGAWPRNARPELIPRYLDAKAVTNRGDMRQTSAQLSLRNLRHVHQASSRALPNARYGSRFMRAPRHGHGRPPRLFPNV